MLRAHGIIVHCMVMPAGMPGYVERHDDIYLVWLNSDKSEDAIWDTLLHELWHIANNDFARDTLIDEVEAENPY